MKASEIVMSKKAVLFDLFHTLVSIETSHAVIPPETHMIAKIDKNRWKECWVPQTDKRIRGITKDTTEEIRSIIMKIAPATPSSLIEKAINTRRAKFATALHSCGTGVIQVLERLVKSGKRIALVSNADELEIAAWADSPLASVFDTAIFSCKVGFMKPEPEIYGIACQQLGVNPQECVFVGDGGSNELTGALRLGMVPIQMAGIISRFWPDIVEERRTGSACQIMDLSELID